MHLLARWKRRLVALGIGIAVGVAASAVVYLVLFYAFVHPHVPVPGGSEFGALLGGVPAHVALVSGIAAHLFSFRVLERRAHLAHENTRIPRPCFNRNRASFWMIRPSGSSTPVSVMTAAGTHISA